MKLIVGTTIPEVWLSAAEHLATCGGEDFDVFLNVASPTAYDQAGRAIYRDLDAFLQERGGLRLESVAETIFPMSYYKREGANGVYQSFPAAMAQLRAVRSSDRSWGTYALRLVQARKGAKNKNYIPLADAVAKIKNHGNYTAAHELGLGPLEEDIEIYQPDTDRNRLYGGPCLSHLSLKVHDGRIRLNATYRSHFYVQRLFGNMLGLAYMQVFIARECGLQVGPLTINSTYARLDPLSGKSSCNGKGWSKRDIMILLANCRAVYAMQPVPAKSDTPLPSDA